MTSTITIEIKSLKKALSVISLAIGADTVRSHCLMVTNGKSLQLYATDNDKVAFSAAPVSLSDIPEGSQLSFTMDPKKTLSAIGMSDADSITIIYDSDTKSTKIMLSDSGKNFLSFPSNDPENFPSLKDTISATEKVGSVDAAVMEKGIRFISGFVSTETKETVFSNIYITSGCIFGSNGSSKIGGFTADTLEALKSVIIRHPIISPMQSFLDKVEDDEVLILESETMLFLSDQALSNGFGFRKSTAKSPEFMLKFDKPEGFHIHVSKSSIIKSITRLLLTSESFIESNVANEELTLQTLCDRPSMESIPCTPSDSSKAYKFYMESNLFKSVLGQFISPDLDIFEGDNRNILFSTGTMVTGKNEDQRKFTETALVSAPRIVL